MSKTARDYDRYLPVSRRERLWGLYVTGAGFGRVPPGKPYPRRGHPQSHEFAWQRGRVLEEHQIVYIHAGQGHFESHATGLCPISAGTILLLFPGDWHRYRPDPVTGWEEYWVGFAGEDAERLQTRGFLSPGEPLLRTGPDDLILHAFTTLLDRMRAEPLGFEQWLAASVWEILAATLSAVRTQQAGSRMHDLIRRAKAILEDQAEGPPVIPDIAARLGLSPSRFQHAFKQYTGFSPYQYHLQLKLHRAEEMLRVSDLPVNQIAELLQFQSVYHFSALFKRKIGQSPSQYRKRGEKTAPGGDDCR
jgi:AraC-like DNA-binding protein